MASATLSTNVHVPQPWEGMKSGHPSPEVGGARHPAGRV
jgi:hypothetical protein